MSAQRKRKKQRPRRTFYEPDQQYIVDWLDSQKNLGMSLQLIITDAIYRYGNGDVIEQYIARRNVAEEFERYPDALPQREVTLTQPVKQSKPKAIRQQQTSKSEPDKQSQRGNGVRDDNRQFITTRNEIQGETIPNVPVTELQEQPKAPVVRKEQSASRTAPKQPNTNASSELVHEGERSGGAGTGEQSGRKVRSSVAHIDAKKQPNQKPQDDVLEADYNPLDVMFSDIGSRFE